ncbi:MAG: hypothetical protein IPI28_07365 [Candidatus Omnitrophica bacterium]|nr:hypothetical protein [Candidatus Omnitrophota bacterium]
MPSMVMGVVAGVDFNWCDGVQFLLPAHHHLRKSMPRTPGRFISMAGRARFPRGIHKHTVSKTTPSNQLSGIDIETSNQGKGTWMIFPQPPLCLSFYGFLFDFSLEWQEETPMVDWDLVG